MTARGDRPGITDNGPFPDIPAPAHGAGAVTWVKPAGTCGVVSVARTAAVGLSPADAER